MCDDGNGAVPEIVARMLMRSEFGTLTFLPALPKALPNGSVKGLRARGGFEVSLDWRACTLKSATVKSLAGNPLLLRYGSKTQELKLKQGQSFTWNP